MPSSELTFDKIWFCHVSWFWKFDQSGSYFFFFLVCKNPLMWRLYKEFGCQPQNATIQIKGISISDSSTHRRSITLMKKGSMQSFRSAPLGCLTYREDWWGTHQTNQHRSYASPYKHTSWSQLQTQRWTCPWHGTGSQLYNYVVLWYTEERDTLKYTNKITERRVTRLQFTKKINT